MVKLVRRHPALALLPFLLVALVAILLARGREAKAVLLMPDVPASDVTTTLLRAGLDSEALAAAGVSTGSTTSVVTAVRNYLNAHPSDVSSADSAYAAAV